MGAVQGKIEDGEWTMAVKILMALVREKSYPLAWTHPQESSQIYSS